MTLIEQIKADREAGTAGLWTAKLSPFEVYNIDHGPLLNEVVAEYTLIAALYDDDLNSPNARRIARVPDMEAALLAADELARALSGDIVYMPHVHEKVAAYRKAVSGREA